jgi:hypothetical protein
MNRLFETVANLVFANFMAAPFMFDMFAPEFPGCGWGGPSSRPARETTCVSPRIAYNAAAGVKRASRARAPSLFRCDGGFLTWAAKPSVSKSPTPPKIPVNFSPESPLPRPSNSLWLKYAIADLKVPSCDFILRMIGRCEPSLGSKKGFVEASSFLGWIVSGQWMCVCVLQSVAILIRY